MTPGFISDVSKVCNYVSAADLMMIIMTMMMTKKTNLANLAPSHRKRPQFSDCHLEYFFSINYKSVSSGALKFTPICPLFHCCPSGRLLQQIIVIWNIYSRSSTNPCHVFTNFPLFSSGISSQHIIVIWNIA